MPEINAIRRALAEIPLGTKRLTLQLRSGEALKGTFQGFDGEIVRMDVGGVSDEVECSEVIDIYLEYVSEGPE